MGGRGEKFSAVEHALGCKRWSITTLMPLIALKSFFCC